MALAHIPGCGNNGEGLKCLSKLKLGKLSCCFGKWNGWTLFSSASFMFECDCACMCTCCTLLYSVAMDPMCVCSFHLSSLPFTHLARESSVLILLRSSTFCALVNMSLSYKWYTQTGLVLPLSYFLFSAWTWFMGNIFTLIYLSFGQKEERTNGLNFGSSFFHFYLWLAAAAFEHGMQVYEWSLTNLVHATLFSHFTWVFYPIDFVQITVIQWKEKFPPLFTCPSRTFSPLNV